MKPIVARIPRLRFVVILGFLLLILVLSPVLQGETRPAMSRMLGLLGLLVPILALVAIDAPGRPRRIAIALAFLCVLASADNLAGFSHLPPQIGIAVCVIFLAYTTARLFAGVVASRNVNADVIAGALASYMLVGLTWAFAYGLLETVRPGSIHGLAEGGAALDFPSLLYFSYITLLTIGYGDITPLSATARMMTVVEGLLGMTFTTIILAVLVSAHLRQRDNGV
ncbi:MAG TPA: potassium channel family protein [Patescibacteria group bacterium]|nr:potassium channel family protein [Patescibacteria group bacterium]